MLFFRYSFNFGFNFGSPGISGNVERGLIVPMLDARRMEVYSSIYNFKHNLIRETRAEVLTQDSFKDELYNDIVTFIGSGVDKSKSIITHKNAKFIENRLPSAKEMSMLSYEKYKISDTEDVAYFEPYYLKDFVALKSKK